ncbi:MarR family winged helix-turn-helix transcriptional regulator [Pseudonocardia endophytica]|uniref:MarR family protein n=1 Tax=Pseudonocardia endophytica TaxID=401976 RepID=A0A4R1HUQ2_PSEEN|nr:MarR family transcriptional regulator [Pseudonocardia endophytica]TCK21172.1 MarR family protein [Pseudonocardia endophytica]
MLSDNASSGSPGADLALGLLGAFRALVDDVHADLARAGHPHARPVHGFALQAIGPAGATAAELGDRLGVSKQAAGKTIDRLAERGYVERAADPQDARRKIVTITADGRGLLRESAAAFDRALAARTGTLGAQRMDALLTALRDLEPAGSARLDLAGWLGS